MQIELTVSEAVIYSGYSRLQLYNLIARKIIKSRKIARAQPLILIDKKSLEDYVTSKGRVLPGALREPSSR